MGTGISAKESIFIKAHATIYQKSPPRRTLTIHKPLRKQRLISAEPVTADIAVGIIGSYKRIEANIYIIKVHINGIIAIII
jgi:hypothetical protein